MLLALKNRVAADFQVRMLEVRHQELQLIVTNANRLALVFSMLAGIMADSMLAGYYLYDIREVGGTIPKGDKYKDNRSPWDELLELTVCFRCASVRTCVRARKSNRWALVYSHSL
jgi:hypothetical protein